MVASAPRRKEWLLLRRFGRVLTSHRSAVHCASGTLTSAPSHTRRTSPVAEEALFFCSLSTVNMNEMLKCFTQLNFPDETGEGNPYNAQLEDLLTVPLGFFSVGKILC